MLLILRNVFKFQTIGVSFVETEHPMDTGNLHPTNEIKVPAADIENNRLEFEVSNTKVLSSDQICDNM